ncbi:MAG: Dynamin- GTPase protein [Chaenotheca gracillima]|nr:MAG: Dynamin- GTPase protein [Chaenotheca gracillima]
MPLRKGATFHSPTSPPSQSSDPILYIPSLPRRSPTCPQQLDDVVAAGERRMAELINLTETGSLSTRSQLSLRGEDLALPRGILNAAVRANRTKGGDMDIDHPCLSPKSKNQPRQALDTSQRQASDSGLGSSIGDSDQTASENLQPFENTHTYRAHPNANNSSAITRSLTAADPRSDGARVALSSHATKKIHKHIILPILEKSTLKDFHSLVRGVPSRIQRKEILCLRDLEKTLLLLAPVSQREYSDKWVVAYLFCDVVKERAKSLAAYLAFCETSIQCLHTTAQHINERDQRRPTDRPYTNGYFLDLVQQVRQYANIMAATRARRDAGQPEDAMDYSPSEKLVAKGGLSQTGQTFQLVREKEGKTIPLKSGGEAEGESDETELSTSLMKRSLSESTEDLARRSMARRRKLANGESVTEPPMVCSTCSKDFSRRCDLTKHEKTHSRPWKCAEPTCRYHRYGWPTQKECDRHFNDKHSDHPEMFICHYGGCTYRSKRESNCKQHMEKAHGWTYNRAKGKRPANATSVVSTDEVSPPVDTPESHLAPTPSTNFASPLTDDFNSSFEDFQFDQGSMHGLGFSYPDYRPQSNAPAPLEYPLQQSPNVMGTYARPQGGHMYNPNEVQQWPGMLDATDFFNPQLNTPFPSAEGRRHSDFSVATTTSMNDVPMHTLPSSSAPEANHIPNLSPAGQNVMLTSQYSPADVVEDEGIDADSLPGAGRPTMDFPLYSAQGHNSSLATGFGATESDHGHGNMFHDLASFSAEFMNSQLSNADFSLSMPGAVPPPATLSQAHAQAELQQQQQHNQSYLDLDMGMGMRLDDDED